MREAGHGPSEHGPVWWGTLLYTWVVMRQKVVKPGGGGLWGPRRDGPPRQGWPGLALLGAGGQPPRGLGLQHGHRDGLRSGEWGRQRDKCVWEGGFTPWEPGKGVGEASGLIGHTSGKAGTVGVQTRMTSDRGPGRGGTAKGTEDRSDQRCLAGNRGMGGLGGSHRSHSERGPGVRTENWDRALLTASPLTTDALRTLRSPPEPSRWPRARGVRSIGAWREDHPACPLHSPLHPKGLFYQFGSGAAFPSRKDNDLTEAVTGLQKEFYHNDGICAASRLT